MIKRILLVLLFALPTLAQYPVSIRLRPPTSMDEQKRTTWTVVVTNRTDEAIPALRFYFSSPGIVSVPDECTLVYSAECSISLAPRGTRELQIVTLDRGVETFGRGEAVAEAIGMGLAVYDQAVFGREFAVTSTADSGPGTLRQAVEDVNRECTNAGPCEIVFRIDGPVPDTGWFTIALLSPLPGITARDVFIDGGSQSRHTGETNPFGGPEIVLDGRAAGEGNGLTFNSGLARVTDLVIGGFRGNGIEVHGSWSMILRNWIGVDGTGRAAMANASRGVELFDGVAYVVDNVLSANGRSGGYFWTSQDVKAYTNFVGVGADGVTPLGNGASGLFFHKPSRSFRASYAAENVIANNAHAGIGVSLGATGGFAANTFRDNGAGAIDVGLDGVTGTTVNGLPGFGGVVGAPQITSARFEDGATIVTGRLAPHPTQVWSFLEVLLFAGSGDTQELVGRVTNRSNEFTIRVNRDLRGQAVRAATYANYIYNWDDPAPGTSELSVPRVVE